ncbi:MAG TPA: non-homologous end-joining DNA ligase [Actinomycetota bacterium]|nr:non-homologous end-joining DNA ligase [Actinomycetota bacterium]
MPETRDYARKRRFDETPEPPPAVSGDVDVATAVPGGTFVIHQHHARRLHFDLRLEMYNGDVPVLVSWAVPKNLPRRKGKPNLAVHVEDHPFEYGSFSGTIPAGNYGAGEVRIFDHGEYELLEQEPGKLTFRLAGQRMRGVWHMALTDKTEAKKDWLVFLSKDERPEPDPLPELSPMLATLVEEPFDSEDWIFELKWDGVRSLAVCSDETALISRNRNDITFCYPELQDLHTRLVCLDAIVDGEIVAMSGGRPSFEKLQSRINLQNPRDIEQAVKTIPVTYVVYDLLYLDGKSVMERPLDERKEMLDALAVPSERVQVSHCSPGEGVALFEFARANRIEGIVAKKSSSVYRPGKRSRDWQKVKTTWEADVVVGGWSKGEGNRSSTFGSLLVGAYSDEGLCFLGSVGTGFSDKTLDEILPLLRDLASSSCPFAEDPSGLRGGRWGKVLKDPQWVEPSLVARVEFRELTAGNKLRAASFKGLRSDKDPDECRLEDLVPEEV